LLSVGLRAGGLDVPVASAGARAVPRLPACPAALTFASPPPFSADHANRSDHASRALEAADVKSASLVLGAAREHRSAAIALVPNAQRKTFTLLQAARLAAWLADQGVKAPPELAGEERLAWWVDELDAVRGDAPRVDPQDDDLPDPHDGGARHDVVLPRLADAAEVLAGVLA
jgi:protein-tyrosine phosphatase